MKSLIRYLVGVVIALAVTTVALPNWLGVAYPASTVPSFDTRIRTDIVDDIVNQQPGVVLLGDSTLELGVDPQLLAGLIGEKVYEIANPGSSSALWYLIIKNNLSESSYKPETLILFFHDTMLTFPSDRVTGLYFPIIDEYANAYDDLLIQLAYRNSLSAFERILVRYLPIYGGRETVAEYIKNSVEYALPSVMMHCSISCMEGITEQVFEYKNLLPDMYGKVAVNTADAFFYTWHQLNFQARLQQSFLPEMVRMCRENNTRLIVVRMGTLYFYSRADEPLWVKGYFKALESYLTGNGVTYVDLAYDSRIKPNHYFDFVHMTEDGKQLFTKILAEKLQLLLIK